MEFRRLAISLLLGGVIGKVAGIARELLLAAMYGTGEVVAAFRIAQTASLVPINFVTSDALNAAFLPLHQRRQCDDAESAEALYRATHFALVTLVTAISGLVLIGANQVVTALAPGLSSSTHATAGDMLRVLALGMPLYVSGVMRSYLALGLGHPQLVSLRSTVVNMGMLCGIAVAGLLRDWIWLAIGFTGSSVVYAGWTYVYIGRIGARPRLRGWMGFGSYYSALGPLLPVIRGLLLLPLLVQVNEVAERVIASLLGESVVAATEYANFVVDSIVTLLAVPLGLAGLASVGAVDDALTRVRERIVSVTAPVMILTVPISAVLALRPDYVVSLVYARGAFDEASVNATATVLEGFAVGLWAQVLGYICIRTFSGTLRIRVLLRSLTASFSLGLAVMLLAVPTKNAVFIGLSGTAYGVTSLLLICSAVSAASTVRTWVLVMAPGACLLVLVDRLPAVWRGHGLAECVVLIATWMLYCAAVPRLRDELFRVVRSRRQAEGK